jgi:hypothetical protein
MKEFGSGWKYVHFGTPCSSFSRLRVVFGTTTRRREQPEGDGSRPDEQLGNSLLAFTALGI